AGWSQSPSFGDHEVATASVNGTHAVPRIGTGPTEVGGAAIAPVFSRSTDALDASISRSLRTVRVESHQEHGIRWTTGWKPSRYAAPDSPTTCLPTLWPSVGRVH